MFLLCTSLKEVPMLPATTLANSCYSQMFQNCSLITILPNDLLPATTLANYCYFGMFSNCKQLTTICQIPATTLMEGCYEGMFHGCDSLTTIPSNLLPATTLADYCYSSMFSDCISLHTICNLPATTLMEGCYLSMFSGCLSIKLSETQTTEYSIAYRIPVTDTGITATDALTNMFASTSGTFIGTPDLNQTYYLYDQTFYDGCFTLESDTSADISLTSGIGLGHTWNGMLYYRTNNMSDWIEWDGRTIIGRTIHLRGSSISYLTKNGSNCVGFKVEGSFHLRGNIENLLNYTTVGQGNHPTMAANCYDSLFQNCNGLTSIAELILPAITLTQYCYRHMFSGCKNLTNIPNTLLSATTLANYCYYGMFQNCSSLLNIPNLPATTLTNYCYAYMFNNCSSLVNITPTSATTLAQHCYESMFAGCTALESLPKTLLPVTTLSTYCYANMFQGCTQLKDICNLPATTLATYCYYYMFDGCTSLANISNNLLLATTLNDYCYAYMFNGCTLLQIPPNLPSSTWAQYCYFHMFDGCSKLHFNTPTYEISSNTANKTGACAYMFANCPSLNKVPSIPLSNIATYTYQYMFYNCTSLQSVDWGTTTIYAAGYSFQGTFMGCTALSSVKMRLYSNGTYAFSSMFNGCASLVDASNIRVQVASSTYNYSCQSMFRYCSSLKNLPSLSLPTTIPTYCCQYMFANCTALTNLPTNFLPSTTMQTYCYAYMFQGCTSLISICALPATTLSTYCYYYMFSGCKQLTYISKTLLPATTLQSYCYAYMFQNCTCLSVLPYLNATTLKTYCYYYMFSGCSSIRLATTTSSVYNQSYRIPRTGTGTTASSALTSMFASTGGTMTGTPAINTTYYYYDYSLITPTEIKYKISSESDQFQTLTITQSAVRMVLIDWGNKQQLLSDLMSYNDYTFPEANNTEYIVKIYCCPSGTYTLGRFTAETSSSNPIWSTVYNPYMTVSQIMQEYTSTSTIFNTAIKQLIPSTGLTRIEMFAFLKTDLNKITNWGQIQSIGSMSLIRNTNLYSIQAPSTSLTTIGNASFGACHNLLTVVIPDSVSDFGSLLTDTTPLGITFYNSFHNDKNLISVTFGSGITNLSTNFDDNGSLTTRIICHATTPPTGVVFANNFTGKIKVPAASLTAYQAATGWSTVANNIEGTADYLYEHGDLVDTIYFNTNLNLGSLITAATATPDLVVEEDPQTGFRYAYTGVNYLYIVGLDNNNNYALVWYDSINTPIPIYTTTASGLSDWGVTTAGWQRSSLTVDPNYESNITINTIPACCFAQMDEVIAKDPLAFNI